MNCHQSRFSEQGSTKEQDVPLSGSRKVEAVENEAIVEGVVP
jgi:hypothetical protein